MHGNFQNSGAVVHCTKSRWDRLVDLIEKAMPGSTAVNLAKITGLKVRACFTFLARKSRLSSDAVFSLMDTRHGPDVICAIMGDSREPWYIEFRIWWGKQQRLRELEEFERDIRGIDADYAREAAVARRDEAIRALGQVGARQAVTRR